MSTPYDELPDLEVVSLRRLVKELEAKLAQAQAILRDNDLLDEKTSIASDEEVIIVAQISKLRELSDKNIPFTVEDVKILEILVKCLNMVRGKAPAEEKPKKKGAKQDVAKLLQFVEESKK